MSFHEELNAEPSSQEAINEADLEKLKALIRKEGKTSDEEREMGELTANLERRGLISSEQD